MNYSEQLEKLIQQAANEINFLVDIHGIESDIVCWNTLQVTDFNFQFVIENGRYLVEVTTDVLIDCDGLQYSFDVLPAEDFLKLADYLKDKY